MFGRSMRASSGPTLASALARAFDRPGGLQTRSCIPTRAPLCNGRAANVEFVPSNVGNAHGLRFAVGISNETDVVVRRPQMQSSNAYPRVVARMSDRHWTPGHLTSRPTSRPTVHARAARGR